MSLLGPDYWNDVPRWDEKCNGLVTDQCPLEPVIAFCHKDNSLWRLPLCAFHLSKWKQESTPESAA